MIRFGGRRGEGDEARILRLAAFGLLAAVWILGMLAPRKGGLQTDYVATFSLLLAALGAVDQTAPRRGAAWWRRIAWLGVELVLCYYVVRVQGSLIRPSLIYLLPASQALLMFGRGLGLALSLSVWGAYGVNIGIDAWPHRLGDFPNYLSFFLAPYIVAVMLTFATLRQLEDRRRLQTLYDELQEAHEELQQLHARVRQTAVTEERNRLAREIHDTLAHYLTVTNVQLEAAEKLASGQPARALEQVRRARRLIVECLQEVRRSVAALRPAGVDESALPGALTRLCQAFEENTGISVRLEIVLNQEERFPPEVALALYRAAQEGLTNVHRHAQATAAHLQLTRSVAIVRLTLDDNGAGRPADAPAGEGGFGLLGLKERVALFGGEVTFGRGPQGGGRLTVTLPAQGSETGAPGDALAPDAIPPADMPSEAPG